MDMLVICTVKTSQLRVTTETLLNVAIAQQPIDCEYRLNTFIMTKVEYR
jgi:hypothetical protein